MGDWTWKPLLATTAGQTPAIAAHRNRVQQHIDARAAAGDSKPLVDQLDAGLHDVGTADRLYNLASGAQAPLVHQSKGRVMGVGSARQ